MAQKFPSTFGITMPIDQIDKARAAHPTIPGMIKEMEKAAKAETEEQS